MRETVPALRDLIVQPGDKTSIHTMLCKLLGIKTIFKKGFPSLQGLFENFKVQRGDGLK